MHNHHNKEGLGDTPLHALLDYQKQKTATFLRWLTIGSAFLCVCAVGLGLLWYFQSSWLSLIFAVFLGGLGLGLAALIFIINEKLELFNNVASGALNIHDKAQKKSTIIDMENHAPAPNKTSESLLSQPPNLVNKEGNGNTL